MLTRQPRPLLLDDVRRRARYTLRFRQLYHDREEITGYCALSG